MFFVFLQVFSCGGLFTSCRDIFKVKFIPQKRAEQWRDFSKRTNWCYIYCEGILRDIFVDEIVGRLGKMEWNLIEEPQFDNLNLNWSLQSLFAFTKFTIYRFCSFPTAHVSEFKKNSWVLRGNKTKLEKSTNQNKANKQCYSKLLCVRTCPWKKFDYKALVNICYWISLKQI